MTYTTKDSGKRVQFETGAQRDTEDGKPRYDLIDVEVLKRLAELMARGAEKYGDDNWREGIPDKRAYSSLYRHLMQWAQGDESEDHLSAVMFNAMVLMYNQDNRDEICGRMLVKKLHEVETREGRASTITNTRDLWTYLYKPGTYSDFIHKVVEPLIEDSTLYIWGHYLRLTDAYYDNLQAKEDLTTP